MSPEKKSRLKSLREQVGSAVGRLLAAPPPELATPGIKSERHPPNPSEFYAAYTESRNRYAAGLKHEGVNLVEDLDRAAYISMLATTEAMYSFDRHHIPYNYGGGFVYPEIRARRITEPDGGYATETPQLDPETRQLALEYTQAWIIHGSSPNADNASLHGSFEHLGCSLTTDCLAADISFEDLGIQPTPEIERSTPSNVLAVLRIDLDAYPESPVIQEVRDAFALRVAEW